MQFASVVALCAHCNLLLFCQTIIMENGVLPKIFLDFLNIRHFPSVPKTESCGWVETAGLLWNKRPAVYVALNLWASLFPAYWKAMWLNFFFSFFSSPRSFDTESEESRWVVLFPLSVNTLKTTNGWKSSSDCLFCTVLSRVMQHVAAHKPSDFSWLSFFF